MKRTKYDSCPVCRKRPPKGKVTVKHLSKCKNKYDLNELGISYVICTLCGFHAKTIGKHLSDVHKMSSAEYSIHYGETVSSNSKKKYKASNAYNCDWINRANDQGVDLSNYKRKMGKALSIAIMADHDSRKRRSEMMAKLNKTDEFRKKSSVTAKKTSLRPDIIASRTKQLYEWRKNNPDEFFEKCVMNVMNSFDSRPERMLRAAVNEMLPSVSFSKGFIKSDEVTTTVSSARQLDAVSHNAKIIVEFDGKHHFDNTVYGNLDEVIKKDKELEQIGPKMGYSIIRVSYDTFSYSKGFDHTTLLSIHAALENAWHCKVPIVIKIGMSYAKS